MSRLASKLVAGGLALITSFTPTTAYADVDPAPTPAPIPARPALVPPTVITFVAAELPEHASRDVEVAVELEFVVDVDGSARDITVVGPAGAPFDEAARAAVARFVFAPATKDGVAMAARIRYRYVFERVAVPPPPEPAATEPVAVEAAAAPEPADDELAEFGAVARVDAPITDLTRRRVTGEELTRVAGTRGDALRTVELLPGVARPPSGMGFVVVRGAAPWDSEVSFEGAPVHNLYHFGGLTSFVHGDLVDGIDLYPGNFSVRYGRRTGSIIRADLRDPRTDHGRAVFDANLIDASALVEGPITNKLSFAAAGRRSYIDAWFGPVVGDAFDVISAPVYWDYQGLLVWKPTSRDRARLLAYGSGDELAIVMGPSEDDPSLRGRLANANTMHRLQGDWRRRWSDDVEHDASLTVGRFTETAAIGPMIGYDIDAVELYGRSEARWTVAPALRLTAGLDLSYLAGSMVYRGPVWGQGEGDPRANDPLATQESMELDRDARWFRPAAYAEATVRPIAPLEVTLGARADYTSDLERWTIDPRAQAKYTHGATTLKAGAGLFTQPPEYGWSLTGGEHLVPSRAIHYGAGVERKLGARASLGVEGFYKDLSKLIVNGESRMAQTNEGIGRIYGLEVAGRINPGGAVSGFLSYTLSKSERKDHADEAWRLFDLDQTHILTASATWKLGGGWIAGGTFRFVSGNPETPVMASIYDADVDTYVPVYGATNSERNPAFHRLDLRIERGFRMLGGEWAGYLDVQNAYNRQNREGTRYSYDYAKRADIPGLPVLPSLGLRGTF